jgi:hypothetical protein
MLPRSYLTSSDLGMTQDEILRSFASHVEYTLARDEFTMMIQGVSAIVTLICLISVTANSASRVAVEREKGTWLVLLTTPMDGPEILGGKLRATAWGLARIAVVLPPFWIVGAVCGAIHPVGASLAAVDLSASLWLGMVLGLWLGIRPGAPSTAISLSSFAAMMITGIHVPYVLLVLAPTRLLSEARAQLPPVRLGLAVLGIAAVPILSALLARLLTRRVFQRFDAYVDRPSRRDGRASG